MYKNYNVSFIIYLVTYNAQLKNGSFYTILLDYLRH